MTESTDTPTTSPMAESTNERPARAGEVCTCGLPATVVYLTESFGEVPYCGQPAAAVVEQFGERA